MAQRNEIEEPKKPEIEPAERAWNMDDPLVVDDVFERIAEGESFRHIATAYGITSSSVTRLTLRDAEMEAHYTRASQRRAHNFAQRIIEVGDDTLRGKYAPDAARVAIDGYKWTAARLLPKTYGDKVEHSGVIGVSMVDALRALSDLPAPPLPRLPEA